MGQPTIPHEKTFLRSKRSLPSLEMSMTFSRQSLERAKFRDKFPSLKVIQTGGKNGRSPNEPPYDQRS